MPNTPEVLWHPNAEFIEQSNLKNYQDWLLENYNLNFKNYDELWKWSISETALFWSSVWEYFRIINHGDKYSSVLTGEMPKTKWFEGTLVNYAEHVFRNKTNERSAIIFKTEGRKVAHISWENLESQVAGLQSFLKGQGIKKGDRVVGFLPNIPEAMIAFLAVNSIGAIWSCCSPDFGVSTVIDRFSQINPKLLITSDGYYYNGKTHQKIDEVKEIQAQLKSVETTVLVNYTISERVIKLNDCVSWEDAVSTSYQELSFTPVPFDHPIWVLYSSGTTGKPKAITHSHGGVLLEHLKYIHFHNDVKAGENFFWFTTTGWMMWNYLQASLLTGATAVLYDGSPGYPSLDSLWSLAEELPIHHFGTSAPFLTACMKKDLTIMETHKLSSLRSIGSTGSPLPSEVYDWVYDKVSKDVWLTSMSGGTDVCTAFVGGVPYKPVIKGRIQGRALGCSLNAVNESDELLIDSLGEMVIDKAMPSMPVFFWNDEKFERYQESYFGKFKDKWCHGDWIRIFEDGSLAIQGRSDATLNRNGIRIGTAEIYAVLNKIEGLKDSLVVNLELNNGGDFMPLFVVLEDDVSDVEIRRDITNRLRSECSPRHVPDKIITVEDLPYTLSGKKMEVPVKKILMGLNIGSSLNKESVRNPESLTFFERLSIEELVK